MKIKDHIAWQKVFYSNNDEEIDHSCPKLQALSVPIEVVLDHTEEYVEV